VISRDALALYLVQGATLLLPLLTVPYLARVLRPAGWGLVVFCQSFAVWLTLLLQFGFSFSATRRVARHRDRRRRLSCVVAGVQGAKLLLVGVTLLVSAVVGVAVPLFHHHPAYLAWLVVGALVQGLVPLWYFQGVERLPAAAAVDVLSRLLAAGAVFLLVHAPADGWRVLALNAAAGGLTLVVTTAWLYREVPFRWSPLRHALATLRDAWGLFVFTGAASVYTIANSFLLGALAGPTAVAFYGSAEKVVRAGSSLLSPISQTLFPRVSHLVTHDPERARRLVRRSLLPIGGLGVGIGVAIAVAAPFLTRVLFGPGYAPVVGILRILAVLPVVLAVGTTLGIQWVLPMGKETTYNRLVIGAGVLNILLAVLLVPRFGAPGMAVAAVLAEIFVEAGLAVIVFRMGDSPWRRNVPAAVVSSGS
jgi:PST family polysaccharide transporter